MLANSLLFRIMSKVASRAGTYAYKHVRNAQEQGKVPKYCFVEIPVDVKVAQSLGGSVCW
jgi:hypothetical protein